MKKIVVLIISLVVVFAISTTVFAAGPHHRQQGQVPAQCPQYENCRYVDNNNDNICDNRTECTYHSNCPQANQANCDGTQIRQHHARGHH